MWLVATRPGASGYIAGLMLELLIAGRRDRPPGGSHFRRCDVLPRRFDIGGPDVPHLRRHDAALRRRDGLRQRRCATRWCAPRTTSPSTRPRHPQVGWLCASDSKGEDCFDPWPRDAPRRTTPLLFPSAHDRLGPAPTQHATERRRDITGTDGRADRTADDHALNLRNAFEDGKDLGVAVHAFDGVFAGGAVAAEDLDGGLDDADRGLAPR